jgi:hypothetical protein
VALKSSGYFPAFLSAAHQLGGTPTTKLLMRPCPQQNKAHRPTRLFRRVETGFHRGRLRALQPALPCDVRNAMASAARAVPISASRRASFFGTVAPAARSIHMDNLQDHERKQAVRNRIAQRLTDFWSSIRGLFDVEDEERFKRVVETDVASRNVQYASRRDHSDTLKKSPKTR